VHFFDADGLPGEDLAEVDFLVAQTDADLSFGLGLINIGNGSWKNPGLNLRIQAPVIAENSAAAQSFPESFPLACPAFLFHV